MFCKVKTTSLEPGKDKRKYCHESPITYNQSKVKQVKGRWRGVSLHMSSRTFIGKFMRHEASDMENLSKENCSLLVAK